RCASRERRAEWSHEHRCANRACRPDRGRRWSGRSYHGRASGQRKLSTLEDERPSAGDAHAAGLAVASRPARATLAAPAAVFRCGRPDAADAPGNTVKFDQRTNKEMIQAIADTVIGSTDELTELDRAIGHADHGVNLERGFNAVLAKIDSIAALPIDAALSEVGKTLILSVGGASGPLYGKLFATIGQHLTNADEITKERVVAACEQAISVIKTLGRSDVGHKTMLDVLVPSLDQLRMANGVSSLRDVRK